jgi:hypothetical protein
MRTSLACVILLGSSLAWCHAQENYSVTPQSLAGWNLAGTDSQTLAAQPELTLPANAQISRAFTTSDLTVHLSTRPYFGTEPADWPVLEVGSAALVFVRNGVTGQLHLVLGEEAPIVLPPSFALDAAGRSLEPLSVLIGRDGTELGLEVAGQMRSFPIDSATGDSVEVVASAGAAQPWAIDRLEVSVLPPATVAPTGSSPSDPGQWAAKKAATPDRANPTVESPASPSQPKPLPGLVPSTAPEKTAQAAEPARATTLEIFTPPAVRTGRAGKVRANVAKNLIRFP